MKIVVFINKDIEANIAFNLLKPELLNHTVQIYYSDSVGNPDNKPLDLVTLEYFEKGFFFNELPTFINDSKINNTFEFFDDNFKSFPIKKCGNVNSIAFINEMKAFNPDVFISIRFGKIFKDDIIQIPINGLINLHSAILPDYRGILGTLHAIKEKNSTIGCTLHTIPNSGIDTGGIIEIAKRDVNLSKSLFWNIIQLYPLGVEMIIKTLKKIELDHCLKTQEQNLEEGKYFSLPTTNDFEQIKNLGVKIITLKDYQDVLIHFILTHLSEIEKRNLTTYLNNNSILSF
jgi:methionyl-tRNA formyltransferase